MDVEVGEPQGLSRSAHPYRPPRQTVTIESDSCATGRAFRLAVAFSRIDSCATLFRLLCHHSEPALRDGMATDVWTPSLEHAEAKVMCASPACTNTPSRGQTARRADMMAQSDGTSGISVFRPGGLVQSCQRIATMNQ